MNSNNKTNIGFVNEIFVRLAGSSVYVLNKCPEETAKHVTLGLIVIMTGCVAGFSMFMMVRSVDYGFRTCLFLGICWGLSIITIDRYILASYRKLDNKWKEFRMMLPRLVMAIIMGVTISIPLELELFRSDVKIAVDGIKQEKMDQLRDFVQSAFRGEIKSDSLELILQRQRFDSMVRFTAAQRNGRTKSVMRIRDNNGGVHYFPIEKQVSYTDLDQDIQKARTNILALEENIKNNKINMANIDSVNLFRNINSNNGLLIRTHALHRVWLEDGYSFFIGVMIFLLLLSLEISPVINKFISPATSYDARLKAMKIKAENELSYELEQLLNENNRTTEKRQLDHMSELLLNKTEWEGRINIQEEINKKFLKTEEEILEKLKEERVKVQAELNKHMLDKVSAAQKNIGNKAVEMWEQKKLAELPVNLDKFINELS